MADIFGLGFLRIAVRPCILRELCLMPGRYRNRLADKYFPSDFPSVMVFSGIWRKYRCILLIRKKLRPFLSLWRKFQWILAICQKTLPETGHVPGSCGLAVMQAGCFPA